MRGRSPDRGNDARLPNLPIRGDQSKSFGQGGTGDDSVSWIFEILLGQRECTTADLRVHRQDRKAALHLGQKGLRRYVQADAFLAGKHSQFQQRHVRNGESPGGSSRFFDRPSGFLRQPVGVKGHPENNIRVEQNQ